MSVPDKIQLKEDDLDPKYIFVVGKEISVVDSEVSIGKGLVDPDSDQDGIMLYLKETWHDCRNKHVNISLVIPKEQLLEMFPEIVRLSKEASFFQDISQRGKLLFGPSILYAFKLIFDKLTRDD